MKKIILLSAVLAFLSVQAHAVDLNVTWGANTAPDLAGYRMYKSLASGVYLFDVTGENFVKEIALGAGQAVGTQVLPLPDDGRTYFSVVTAIDASGNESGPSNEISFDTDDLTPPAPPTGYVVMDGS